VPKKSLTTKQAMRYNRQIVLPHFDLDKQERLLNANVLLIGVGGLGCAAAQYLVASGVGKITLVDDDTVDSSNLQRQILHGEADVGINKGMSARASLQQLNKDCEINVLLSRLAFPAQNTFLDGYDLVLDCSDNLPTRDSLNQACYTIGTPLVSGAAIRMEGQLMCIDPKQHSACYACLSQYFTEQNLTCVESGVMSPVVGIIGAMQALEAIKILTDYGQTSVNKLMMFDGMTATWQTFKVPKSVNCTICG
jgi:adenylyltransferase/sulfurtransferase